MMYILSITKEDIMIHLSCTGLLQEVMKLQVELLCLFSCVVCYRTHIQEVMS